MIAIDIPGHGKIEVKHLVLDYNGTLAIDGKLISGTRPLLENISRKLTIHVLTADTFGTSKKELTGINCNLKILKSSQQDIQKEGYLVRLAGEQVIAIGNGMNDSLMLKKADIGIAVVQKEGTSIKSLLCADIVCSNIIDALEMIIYTQRIVATLRN